MSQLLPSGVINSPPPDTDAFDSGPVLIFGDSSLNQYTPDPAGVKATICNDELAKAARKVFPEKFVKAADFIYDAHHGAGMKFFLDRARLANASPNAVYIGAVFLNDFVDSFGKVKWDKVTDAALSLIQL